METNGLVLLHQYSTQPFYIARRCATSTLAQQWWPAVLWIQCGPAGLGRVEQLCLQNAQHHPLPGRYSMTTWNLWQFSPITIQAINAIILLSYCYVNWKKWNAFQFCSVCLCDRNMQIVYCTSIYSQVRSTKWPSTSWAGILIVSALTWELSMMSLGSAEEDWKPYRLGPLRVECH